MEGVEILNIYKYQNFQPLFVVLGGVIGVILGIIIAYLINEHFDVSDSGFQAMVFLIGLLGVVVGSLISFSISKKETRYDVTIEDSVSYKEFTEKYEVIEVNGKIYTIVEKEVEEQ